MGVLQTSTDLLCMATKFGVGGLEQMSAPGGADLPKLGKARQGGTISSPASIRYQPQNKNTHHHFTVFNQRNNIFLIALFPNLKGTQKL